jgi:hypothetical protein
MVQPAELLQAHRDGSNRRPVVQRLAGDQAPFQLDQVALHRDQIAHPHQPVHLFGRQSNVDEQFISPERLGPFGAGQHVRRRHADYPGQRPVAMDHHLLAGQDPIVVPPYLLKVDEAVFQLPHDQTDLVHVCGQHHDRARIRAGSPLYRDHIAQGIDVGVVGKATKGFLHNGAYLMFIARYAMCFSETF